MKRFLAIILVGILCCGMLAGCSDTQNEEPLQSSQRPASGEAVTPSVGAVDSAASDAQPEDTTPSAAQAYDGIVDLTQLSSTMVYAEVYNMMMTPEAYIGKTIKMNGLYYASNNPELEIYYHFVIIEDATACCAQGLEFILNGEHTYPDDYPEDETPVEVTGVWGSYEEDGNTYYYIAADDIAVL